MYQHNAWTARNRMLLRVILVCAVFVSALLLYPVLTLGLATVALARYGAYEAVLAGVVLDALRAPGTGMFGDFTYTVLLLGIAFGASLIRYMLRGDRGAG